MPSSSPSSSIRLANDDYTLHLKITHNVVPDAKDVDVLWLSDIAISLAGSLDGRSIPAPDIASSGLVQLLHAQLTANADQLGLNNVSRPFVDAGLAKLSLTPSRPLPPTSRPHAILVSLHLAYIWRTIPGRAESVHPFSPSLFLPAQALLHRATNQFLTYHLVGRYPLIFGLWCKKLDLEMQYFPSIAQSVLEIMNRSDNHAFVSKCNKLLKVARRHHKFVHQTSIAALSSCADDATDKETDSLPATPVLTDEQILCQSLEQLFREGVPRRRFKPAATPQLVSSPEDDDESLLQCVDTGADDDASWSELIDIPPSPVATDPYPTSHEDMDVFATEDWPGEGTGYLQDTETSLGEDEWDSRSDESLINASISVRLRQGCPFTLYHHPDVDHREGNPAGLCDASELAPLEDPESSAMPSSPADPHYSQNYEQLTRACEVDSNELDIWSESDEIIDINEVTALDVSLDWV